MSAVTESPAWDQLHWLMAPVQPWCDDPATEEICVNTPGEAWLRQRGAWSRHDVPLGYEDLVDIAILAAAIGAQDVGKRNPLCATDLPGLRMQFCLPPIVPAGTVSWTIRRHGEGIAPLSAVTARYRMDGWNRWRSRAESRNWSYLLGLFDAGDIAAFLAAAVRARLTMLLCGATGAGKTTFLITLLASVPEAERIITIEDTFELRLQQPNHVRLRYSKGDLSSARVTSEDLLQACLRMRPDRIMQAELRDDAAMTWINEVTAGHPGSMATIHGDNPAEAFRRLFTLCKSASKGASWDDKTLIGMLSGAVDLIVPFRASPLGYEIGAVWFAADAARRGETAADLLKEG